MLVNHIFGKNFLKYIKQVFRKFHISFFAIIAILVVLFGAVNKSSNEKIRTSIMDFFSYVNSGIANSITVANNAINDIKEIFILRKENEVLRQENLLLREYYDLSKHLEVENGKLRQLLNVVKEEEKRYVTARVIGDVSGPFVRSAMINAGTEVGVNKGQIVINSEGVVGRIIEVGEKTSRVLLLTDLNSRIPVITAKARERSIAAGNNSEYLTLLYLPEDTKVEVGEEIITSGDGSYFPFGLLIGKVKKINDKEVIIEPAAKWSRLEYVSIINYGP